MSDSDRKSTFICARAGIEFTDVPPSISPILKLVLGDSGTRAATVGPEVAVMQIKVGKEKQSRDDESSN